MPASPTLFRAYIGPRWRPTTHAHAWDWSRTQDFDLTDKVGRVLSIVASGATTASIDINSTATLLPAKGGLWLGPKSGNASEGWEHVEYSSRTNTTAGSNTNYTLSGLLREPSTTREHNGIHTYTSDVATAPVHFWAPLNTNDGKIHIVEEMDANLVASTWSAELSGVLAPRGFLRNEHAVYIKTAESSAGPWTSLLLGWIEEFQVEDDSKRIASWAIRINCIAGVLNRQACPPVRIGDLDIARNGRIVQTSQILAHPVKERNSGDYVAAEPDLSGASLIDGDAETLCIWEKTLGPSGRSYTHEFAAFGNQFIGQANLTIPTGLGKGYRWIQVYSTNNGGAQTFWDPVFASGTESNAFAVNLGGNAGQNARIVACENLTKYFAMFPLADPTRVAEIGPTFFDGLNLNSAVGDVLGIGNNASGGWQGVPYGWGSNPPTKARFRNEDGSDEEALALQGAPTPINGKILRWVYNAALQPTAMFTLSDCDTGAYNDPIDPWVLIQLPGMGLRLLADLTIGYTGVLEVSDGSATSTNGLPASGTVQIGGEQLTYTSKTATTITITARGANSTTAAVHEADDPVYIFENGQATDAYKIHHVTIKRPTGTNAPKSFTLRISNMIVPPRMPTTDNNDPSHDWHLDYHAAIDVVGHLANEWTWQIYTSPTLARANWLLVEIHAMQTEPARARLNSIEAWIDSDTFDAAQWLPEDTTIGEAYEHIFSMLGLPASAITDLTTSTDPFQLLTGEKPAWPVLVDLADYTNTLIKVSYLNAITLSDNKMWRTDTVGAGSASEPFATYTRSTAKAIQTIQERTGAVKQLKMTWINEDGSEGSTLVYPSPADDFGEAQELKSSIYPNSGLALASMQRRYIVLKYPASIGVELATGTPGMSTGLFYGIDWTFHDGTTANRIGLAQSIDTVLEKQNWITALRLIGVREANY